MINLDFRDAGVIPFCSGIYVVNMELHKGCLHWSEGKKLRIAMVGQINLDTAFIRKTYSCILDAIIFCKNVRIKIIPIDQFDLTNSSWLLKM